MRPLHFLEKAIRVKLDEMYVPKPGAHAYPVAVTRGPASVVAAFAALTPRSDDLARTGIPG
ncbi:MAG: hypothetical protein BMS9Abin28_0750 [Anaerolineae bacterium]|nr:MAG: hypothetical protein BMS9Abin28_0750 [Anaerolineae bacterium]